MKKDQEKKPEQRTGLQNRALYKYFELVSERLNAAGLDIRIVLQPGIEISWTKDMVKQLLWHPIQRVKLGKESTTELNTTDIDVIFEELNRHIGSLGIHEPFPSYKTILDKLRENDEYGKKSASA